MTPGWRDRAACMGMAPLFDAFVEGESPAGREARHHRARTVCHSCPVRSNCLAEAVAGDGRVDGVWGGVVLDNLNNRHRPKPEKRRADIAHGTAAGYRAHYRVGETPCRACRDADRIARDKYRRAVS